MATRHLFYAYMVSQATEVAAQLKQTISIQIQPKFYRGNNCAEIELWYHADTPTRFLSADIFAWNKKAWWQQ